MSESKLNKSASQGYQTFKQSMIKPTSFFSILLVTIGVVTSSHSAIASTSQFIEQAITPDSTLHAQMNNGSMNGRTHKSKMHKMKKSKMHSNMGRSKMGNNMGRSKMNNNMGRSMDNSKK